MMNKALQMPKDVDSDSNSSGMHETGSTDDAGLSGDSGESRSPFTSDASQVDVKELAAEYLGPDVAPTVGATTLMIRNLPRSYTEEALVREIETVTGRGTFDFLYMPWDARRGSNISYAFVNFNNQEATQRCFYGLSGRQWRLADSSKCCRIAAAHVQGLAANLVHYRDVANMPEARRHAPIVMLNGTLADYEDAVRRFCAPEAMDVAIGKSPVDMANADGAPPSNDSRGLGAADARNSQIFQSDRPSYPKGHLDYNFQRLQPTEGFKAKVQRPLHAQKTSASKSQGPRSDQISELQMLMQKAEALRCNPIGQYEHRMELGFTHGQHMAQKNQHFDGQRRVSDRLYNKQNVQQIAQQPCRHSHENIQLKDKLAFRAWLQQRLDITEQAGRLGDARAFGMHSF